MFHAIFGFDATLEEPQTWLFNTNHLFLVLCVAAIAVLLCIIISPKTESGRKITKIIIAFVLIVLEMGRMVYNFKYNMHRGYTTDVTNWWAIIDFNSCKIMTWTTAFTLIASCLVKKESKVLQFFYNIMFGCGMLGATATFLYPMAISGIYPIYHISNIQIVITHLLLIIVPILLVKWREFKVELKNIWQLIVYYLAAGSIALAASICGDLNFAFTISMNWISLAVPFPYHAFVVVLGFVAIAAVIYSLFELCRYIKNKKLGIHPQKQHINKADLFITIFMYATSIVITSVIYSVIALNVWQGKATLWGLLELLPLCYLVISMLYCNYYSRYITKRFDTERTAKHTVLILCFCVLNLPAGIAYFVRYATAFNQYIKQI